MPTLTTRPSTDGSPPSTSGATPTHCPGLSPLRIVRVRLLRSFRCRRTRNLESFPGAHVFGAPVSYGGYAFLPGAQVRERIDERRTAGEAAAEEPQQVVAKRVGQSGIRAEHEVSTAGEACLHPSELSADLGQLVG